MMNKLCVVFKSELSSLFHVSIAYIYLVVFLFLAALLTFTSGQFFEIGEASLSYSFFRWHPWIYAFLVPSIGMRIWTKEAQCGTIEVLFSQPVRLSTLLMGKYTAAYILCLLALLLTFPMVLTVEYLGTPDYGEIGASYLGSALLCGAFLSISCMFSAISTNQVNAYMLSALTCVVLVLLGSSSISHELISIFPRSRWLVDSIASLSIRQYFTSFRHGVIEIRSVLYFIIINVLGLLLSYYSLLKKQD